MEVDTMANVITSVGDIVTGVIGWCGSILDWIVSEPLLLLGLVGFFFVGGAVGILMRVMRG